MSQPHLVFLAIVLATISGCAQEPDPVRMAMDHPVVPFSLTERNGKTVTRDDLLGKVWITSFVFTHCSGACPQLAASMARLQKELADKPDVVLVTITVDPDRDTPKVLQEYAQRFQADSQRWLFLTGKQDDIYTLIKKGFQDSVEQNTGAARTPGNEVLHSPRLFVVDRKGHVRGFVDGRQVDNSGKPINELPLLSKKVAALLREQP